MCLCVVAVFVIVFVVVVVLRGFSHNEFVEKVEKKSSMLQNRHT